MFGKKKNKDLDVGWDLIETLNGKEVEYVVTRNKRSYREKIIGKNGRIALHGEYLLIICQNSEIFRAQKATLRAFELMSLNGVTFNIVGNDDESIIAYYKYYLKKSK